MTAPETHSGVSTPPPRRRRLGNLRNVKGALADVIHRIDTGEIEDVKRANALIYGLSTLAGVIAKELEAEKLTDLEEQIAALTETLK